ncbi:hypothetical protein EMCRGX_G027993 [Ephydatia muelleri]
MAERAADIQASATADWNPLGEVYVKRYLNYELDWGINLADYLVAMSPFAGPVALMPKQRQTSMKPEITICTLAGKKISTIPWEGGRVIELGWTLSENLVCVLEDGSMIVYDINGQLLYSRIIQREIQTSRVQECKFFSYTDKDKVFGGFAVMTCNMEFYIIVDIDKGKDEVRVKKLAALPDAASKPGCWAPLCKESTSVIVTVEDRVYLLSHLDATLYEINCGKKSAACWMEVAVTLNGKAVALFDREGYMWAGTTDFKSSDTEFDLQLKQKVARVQMQWGEMDYFVLVIDRIMFVKGLGKHWCKYPFHNYAQGLVSTKSLNVLRIGVMEPGALLNDAYKEYEGDESHKADEFVRFIKDKLSNAVLQCIDAAGEEFVPKVQKSLLKSANFGKGFLGSEIQPELVNAFVETCRELRVLNSVRLNKIGIPITLRQYRRLSSGVFVDRLIYHGLYHLALEICDFLKIPPSEGAVKVLRNWALRKVQDKSMSDADVAQKIKRRLKDANVVVSYGEIARAAMDAKRLTLAADLLRNEVFAQDQVPLLMEMDSDSAALEKAIESGDPKLKRYYQMLHFRPVAAALCSKVLKETDQEQLLRLYRQESLFIESGCMYFAQSFTARDPDTRKQRLFDAQKEFRDAQDNFATKAIEEHAKLTTEVIKLGLKETATLSDAVIWCVKNRQSRQAEQLRKDFKMTDHQYWWAMIRGLCDIGDYAELDRFSKQKKPPIGFEAFAEVCIVHENYREAAKYIPKAALENRYHLYLRIQDYSKAADVAYQTRNISRLDEVAIKAARTPEIVDLVRQYKAKLEGR